MYEHIKKPKVNRSMAVAQKKSNVMQSFRFTDNRAISIVKTPTTKPKVMPKIRSSGETLQLMRSDDVPSGLNLLLTYDVKKELARMYAAKYKVKIPEKISAGWVTTNFNALLSGLKNETDLQKAMKLALTSLNIYPANNSIDSALDVKDSEDETKSKFVGLLTDPSVANQTGLGGNLGHTDDAFQKDDQTGDDLRASETAANSKHGSLKEKHMKALFPGGVIHFGNNTSKDGVGKAVKGMAIKVYGGQQLTFANVQEAIKYLDTNPKAKAAAKTARSVNNASASIALLEKCIEDKKVIYFHLNLFSKEIIQAIKDQDENFKIGVFQPVTKSVTAQELAHIMRFWDKFKDNVIFMRNLTPVSKPW